MTSVHKSNDGKFTEQALLIALICLEVVFVAIFAISSGVLRP